MVKQLALQFCNVPQYLPSAFVVGDSNRAGFDWLMAYPSWRNMNTNGMLLIGEKSSGKTHMCHVFCEAYPEALLLNGASLSLPHPFDIGDTLVVIDDADRAPANWLFHFYNHMKAIGGHFIMTMHRPYQTWCDLADLSSRLATLPHFSFDAPDDYVMISLMKNKLLDLGIRVEETVLSYLAQHIERSYSAIDQWIYSLNQLSAEQKKSITIPFIRSLLNTQN